MARSLSEFMAQQGFQDPVFFETGCSAWRNSAPPPFTYPEIETDPEKRASLAARIDEIADAKMPSSKKTKKAMKPKESTDADEDRRSSDMGVALDDLAPPRLE